MENIIRINGRETQTDINTARNIQNIINQRNEFSSTRIQILDMNNFDLTKEFSYGVKRRK